MQDHWALQASIWPALYTPCTGLHVFEPSVMQDMTPSCLAPLCKGEFQRTFITAGTH